MISSGSKNYWEVSYSLLWTCPVSMSQITGMWWCLNYSGSSMTISQSAYWWGGTTMQDIWRGAESSMNGISSWEERKTPFKIRTKNCWWGWSHSSDKSTQIRRILERKKTLFAKRLRRIAQLKAIWILLVRRSKDWPEIKRDAWLKLSSC